MGCPRECLSADSGDVLLWSHVECFVVFYFICPWSMCGLQQLRAKQAHAVGAACSDLDLWCAVKCVCAVSVEGRGWHRLCEFALLITLS